MKHNYFKKAALACLLLGTMQGGFAQLKTVGALYSTGGSYGEPGNKVTFGLYDSEFNDVSVIDTITGDFSNFADFVDGVAYFHVGRGATHPAGADMVVAYYTYQDSISLIENANGAKFIQPTKDYVALLKAFGTDNGQYLEVFDKNDMNTRVFADSLTINSGGLTYDKENAILFASYSTEENGEIAAYDLNGNITKTGVLLSDSMLKGIKQIFFDEENNWLVGAAKNSYYNQAWQEVVLSQRLFKLDFNTDSLTIVDIPNVPSVVKYVEAALVGDFGQGLSVFDVEDMTMLIEPLSTLSYTDFEIDFEAPEIYYLNTDYFSFGSIVRTPLFDTTAIASASVGISGESIKLMQTYAPVAVNDYYEVGKNGSVNFNPADNDTDEDLPSEAKLEVEFDNLITPNGSVIYSQISGFIYTPNQDFIGLDSIEYSVYDNLGASAEGVVLFNVSESNNIQENQISTLFVYPNPTSDKLTLSVPSNNARVVITNLQGQEVLVSAINKANEQVDVSSLPVGFYLIELTVDNDVYRTSFEKI